MTWPCEAYGQEAMKHGALCFASAELDVCVCSSPSACHRLVESERRRVFQRINELAAAGDPIAEDLAESFPAPNDLLGGKEEPPLSS